MKKGIASMTIIYSFLIVFILVLMSLLALYSQKARLVDSIVMEAKEELTIKTEKVLLSELIYTGEVQEFKAPYGGYYEIELWGAGTQADVLNSTRGAYTKGTIYLEKAETVYVYVGGSTSNNTPGYNGGGAVSLTAAKAGNGATDVRLVKGSNNIIWNETASLNSRIMIAAGGAGNATSATSNPGNGGTLFGETGIPGGTYTSYTATGGTQTSGGIVTNFSSSYAVGTNGSFATGGTGGGSSATGSSGGGGGYYGGAGGSRLSNGSWPGGGGSSFISGHAGVNAISSAATVTHTNNTLHYSGKYFIDTDMEAAVNNGN